MAKKNKKGAKRGSTSTSDTALKSAPKDIVIPVMGPTGAGKSTFINALVGENCMEVGHKLASCTKDLQTATITCDFPEHPQFQGHRLVIVDTPGFDDTYEGDVDILRRIAKWLEDSYLNKSMALGGVIYLHDISNDRFSGTARRNLEMFQHLCGEAALQKVVLGTTKWKRVAPGAGESHKKELREVHWKSLIDRGSSMGEFRDGHESARQVVKEVLKNLRQATLMETALQIQEELVNHNKIVPETKAGKELRFTLQEVLAMQKQAAQLEASTAPDSLRLGQLEEKMAKIVQQIQELKIPLGRRFSQMIRSLFGG